MSKRGWITVCIRLCLARDVCRFAGVASQKRIHIVIALLTGVLAIVLLQAGMKQWNVITATVVGATVGVVIEQLLNKSNSSCPCSRACSNVTPIISLFRTHTSTSEQITSFSGM